MLGCFLKIILNVDDGAFSTYQQKCVVVVQQANFTRRHEITPGILIVCAVASISPPRPAIRVCNFCTHILSIMNI